MLSVRAICTNSFNFCLISSSSAKTEGAGAEKAGELLRSSTAGG